MSTLVDVVTLSRMPGPLPAAVRRGLQWQESVDIRLHRIVGSRTSRDTCRWDTIVRARNLGKHVGSSRWLMFLDDDVVLSPGCLRALLNALVAQPGLGAVAADYLGESPRNGKSPTHVSMGATLFRRLCLDNITFRWEPGRCECQCCCDDIRRHGVAITYCDSARAIHLGKQDIRVLLHGMRAACAHVDKRPTGAVH
jgi:hypothetical protein